MGFALRAAILHECQNYLGGGGGLEGSEKNRGTVIISLQLAFRRRDRNFTTFTINRETPLAMKNMPDTLSIYGRVFKDISL